jgi:hypothetical protein
MHRSLLAAVLVLLASCGPGQPTYIDRVKALPSDKVHPWVAELLPLLLHPEGRAPDDLMRTWKQFLGTAVMPLRQDTAMTFVYYDFGKTLGRVYLEASFSPGRLEPLTRLGTTSLFYRTYDVPKPERVRYRFSDGKTPLPDPFHADIVVGPELWQQAVEVSDTEIIAQNVVGASETLLAGQDVRLVLPPQYRRNLAWTYPVVIVVGLEGDGWVRPLAQLMEQNAVRPLVAVSVGLNAGNAWTTASLKLALEDRVVPWLRTHYRVSVLPSDMTLVGWGDSARTVQEVAAGRTDFWTKTWIPPATQAQGEDAWNSQAQAWLRTQFAVINP